MMNALQVKCLKRSTDVSTGEAFSMNSVLAIYYRDGTKDVMLEEIIKAEGLPYTRLEVLDSLEGVKALILGEKSVPLSQLENLKTFVENGGILIAVRPENCLSKIFGVEDTGRVQKDGYIILKGKNPYENVSYEGRLQIFGFSKLYIGGENIVNLSPSEDYGGIIKSQFGEGAVFIVAYDVSTTFLTIQQQNSRVGRAYDTSVVEVELSDVPQLDLMRRLFANLVLESINMPLPRKWYFPKGHKALVLLSGDQDGADYEVMSSAKNILKECGVPYTLFITPRSQPLSYNELQEIAQIGVEIALHPDFIGYPFTEEEFKTQLKKAEGDSGAKIIGVRNHCIRWEEVIHVPIWIEKYGLQYDSNLGLRLPIDEHGARPPKLGYFVGGGLPYFFIHPKSFKRIDVLEEPLFVSDDILWLGSDRTITVNDIPNVVKTFRAGMGLSQEDAFQLLKKFMDESLEKYYTVQCYDFHPFYLWRRMSDSCFRKIVEYCKEKGILLMNQAEWNYYWRGREEVQYVNLVWNSTTKTLEFTIRGKRDVKDMTFIVPLLHQGFKAKVYINGVPAFYREEYINKKQYALFTVNVGLEEIHIKILYESIT
jgi:hypothetical protein